MTRTAPKRLLSRSFAVRTVADTLLTRPLAPFRSVLAEFPTPWRCSDIHFEDIVLDGVGVGISVDMTYETPGSTHENIGADALSRQDYDRFATWAAEHVAAPLRRYAYGSS